MQGASFIIIQYLMTQCNTFIGDVNLGRLGESTKICHSGFGVFLSPNVHV